MLTDRGVRCNFDRRHHLQALQTGELIVRNSELPEVRQVLQLSDTRETVMTEVQAAKSI